MVRVDSRGPSRVTSWLLVCALMLCLPWPWAQLYGRPKLQSFILRAPMRYEAQRSLESQALLRSRTQLQVTADLKTRLIGEPGECLQLATLIGSGGSFTSQWSTLYDHLSSEQRPLDFSMRQLYLHHENEVGRFSLGVIPPVKEVVSHTSMDNDGWIRGARAVFKLRGGGPADDGVIELVTGAVDHLDQPSAFQLPTRWNYHEFEWTHHWLGRWRTELGAVSLEGDRIVRSEARYRYRLERGLRLEGELSGELLYNIDAAHPAYDLTLLMTKGAYQAKLEYSKIDERFGLLGRLVDDYFSLGTVKLIALRGPLPSKGISWFARLHMSDTIVRGMAGVSYSLQLLEKGRRREAQ